MPVEQHGHRQLAACYRATYFGLAVLAGVHIIEVRRHRVRTKADRGAQLRQLLTELAQDYAITNIVVEPDPVLYAAACRTSFSVQTLNLKEAKHLLLPSAPGSTLPEVCEHLLRRHPRLYRLVSVAPVTGLVDVRERSGTAPLLAVALGLAAITKANTLSLHNKHFNSH